MNADIDNDAGHAPPTLAQQLQCTLVGMLAKTLRLRAEEIDVDRPLPHYGLDSIDAVTLAGDLEDLFDIDLPSTLLWDYPTVAAIAGFLEEQLEAAAGAAPGTHAGSADLRRLDPAEVDELLAELIP